MYLYFFVMKTIEQRIELNSLALEFLVSFVYIFYTIAVGLVSNI